MARMRFEIRGESTGISLPTYSAATFKLLQLLREIDSAVSGKHGGMVNWYIVDADKNGTLSLELESHLKPEPKHRKITSYDTAPKVAQSFVTGFENVESLGISPPFLSESGLEKLRDMVQLLSKNGAKSFIATVVDENNRSVAITAKAVETLKQLIPSKREELGTIEGKLETVSIHGSKKFIIYESITGKGVTCIMKNEDLLKPATDSLGCKVMVTGIISFNIKNEPCKVLADSIRVLGAGKKIPTADDLFGSDQNFTGDLSTDEYIREIRRG
jgi:hypothetical protein